MLNEDCMAVIKEFLCERFRLDPDAICIQRAHRIGRFKQERRNVGNRQAAVRHMPLIVAFRDYQDCELILSNASNLKDTAFGVSRDYPQELINARKPLRAEMKTLKSKFPRAKISIQYPAKLIIDGRVHQDMFPRWREYMKCDRLHSEDSGKVQTSDSSVQDNELSHAQSSEHISVFMDTEAYSSPERVIVSDVAGGSTSNVNIPRTMSSLPSREVSSNKPASIFNRSRTEAPIPETEPNTTMVTHSGVSSNEDRDPSPDRQITDIK